MSEFHDGVVHTLMLMNKAITIAVVTEWNELKNLPAWDHAKAKAKADVVCELLSRTVILPFLLF